MAEPSATNPADLGAIEARQLIARKALSPVELASACIERVEDVDHAVNALVARRFDALLDEAKAAEDAVMSGEALGALHGLPFGVKDMIDVKGLPTTFGSEAFKNNIATGTMPSSRPCARPEPSPWAKPTIRMERRWQHAQRVYGVTANPHDLSRTCAGSSGGSAVSLACGYAPAGDRFGYGRFTAQSGRLLPVLWLSPQPGRRARQHAGRGAHSHANLWSHG